MSERQYSPSETARLLGLSVKALRLYEQHGLVTPLRSAASWRTYGPAQIARLHQIVALKRLGLSLARIAHVLAADDALDGILELQERVLARESLRIGRALDMVRLARARLADGMALSIDDLATLTKDTTMTTKADPEEMKAIFDPLLEKHFTPQERAALSRQSFDPAEAQAAWDALIEEAKDLMEKGDPTSAAARDMARRWQAQVRLFSQGDPEMSQKAMALWQDAMADPAAALRLPLNPEIFAFVQKASLP